MILIAARYQLLLRRDGCGAFEEGQPRFLCRQAAPIIAFAPRLSEREEGSRFHAICRNDKCA